jgi:single-stranded-DNA-specific exonuclease
LDSIATRHPGLIGKFGGHAMAAGMTLFESDLERFRAAFAAEIAVRADPDALMGIVHSDGELQGVELSVDTARTLRGGGPWGQGFPEPVFDGEFTIIDARIVGSKHLKLQLEPISGSPSGADSRGIDAIAFGYIGGPVEDASVGPGRQLRIAYRLEVNDYRGVESMQLNCQHLKLA